MNETSRIISWRLGMRAMTSPRTVMPVRRDGGAARRGSVRAPRLGRQCGHWPGADDPSSCNAFSMPPLGHVTLLSPFPRQYTNKMLTSRSLQVLRSAARSRSYRPYDALSWFKFRSTNPIAALSLLSCTSPNIIYVVKQRPRHYAAPQTRPDQKAARRHTHRTRQNKLPDLPPTVQNGARPDPESFPTPLLPYKS